MSKPATITLDNVEYVRRDSIQKETIKSVLEGDFQPFEIGGIYLIRTVTMIQTGRVVAASHRWVVLADAAWIASTGRFSDALKKCEFGEVEPFPDGALIPIGVGAIIDACPIKEVQRSQK